MLDRIAFWERELAALHAVPRPVLPGQHLADVADVQRILTALRREASDPALGERPPEVWQECPDCHGEGATEKPMPFADDPYFCIVLACETCGGAGGAIHETEGEAMDTLSRTDDVECPACRGQGVTRGPQSNMPWSDCVWCKGSGVVSEEDALAHDSET